MTQWGELPVGDNRMGAAARSAAVRLTVGLAVVLTPVPVFAQALDGDRLADPPRPPAPINTPAAPGPSPAALTPADNGPRVPPPTSFAPATVPAPAPPPVSSGPVIPAGQSPLTVSARFGPNQPAITGGLHWRVYGDRPDHTGVFRLLKEDRGASPTFVLPAGDYVVAVSFGLASSSRRVQLGNEPERQVFELGAGGARFEGKVGDSKIPPGQISFDVFRGSQFEPGDNKRPIAQDVATGDLVLLPEGVYYVVSNYGDSNAVVRSDIRVQSGKLTDVTINHRAAVITLKLVSVPGGEALANTSWSVLTPGGDVIKESIGAFPRVVLAEGDYVAIARNDGKVYNQSFKVEPGFDREIEVPAR
jgi:hypothetical protein